MSMTMCYVTDRRCREVSKRLEDSSHNSHVICTLLRMLYRTDADAGRGRHAGAPAGFGSPRVHRYTLLR